MRTAIAAFGRAAAAAAAAALLCGAGRGWQDDGREWKAWKGGRAASPPVVIKRQVYTVPRPNAIRDPGRVVTEPRSIAWPRRDGTGARIVQPAAAAPPSHHTTVVRNSALVSGITAQQRVEVVPNRYYWHNTGGVRYCHYYDDRRVHWYGFYFGPTFYWTRYDYDRWWWFDVRFGRWVYWWDGFWWWPGPAGVVYVYVDNGYYPYDEAGVMVRREESPPPPSEMPAAGAGSSAVSPGGARMVQIAGAGGDAFLYDDSGKSPVFLKFLGTGAEKARFSGGTGGKPLQIMLEFKDGTYALYDADGVPQDVPAPEGTPGPPPGSEPPAPAAAPPR